MANNRTDPRVVRTRKMLRDALMELIREKGLEGITVRELTEKAGLYRGTFYLHYRDIYDLLEQSQEEMLQGIRDIAAQVSPLDFQKRHWLEEPHPSAIRMFEYYADNAVYFHTILGPKGDPAFPAKLKELMRELFQNNEALLQAKDADIPIPRDFFISYIISANIGLLQHWFDTGMVQTPREMALMSMRMRMGLAQTTGF
ncbi:TetR/AcrR family transcriptional regulator [Paenibacillus sp. P26]|nr:TetR/AcrR family transcriptional regulator [Paenibacillus sp. P26]UUZ91035.1 TetR/AcrR family transcriptional regulator [Paenibacillus sp. P25]